MAIDRRRPQPVATQVRAMVRLVSLWGFVALTLAIARLGRGGVADDLFLDPQTLTDRPWYAGAISDFNIVVWAVSSAVASFGGWVAFQTNRPTAGRFLLGGGVVSTWLLIDDMFLLHAEALPHSVGLPEAVSVLAAIAPVLAWVLGFRREIRRTRWVVLGCSIFAFEFATVAGLYGSVAGGATVVDDSATFLGACAWGLYFALTTRDIVRSTVRTAMEREREPVADPPAALRQLASTN